MNFYICSVWCRCLLIFMLKRRLFLSLFTWYKVILTHRNIEKWTSCCSSQERGTSLDPFISFVCHKVFPILPVMEAKDSIDDILQLFAQSFLCNVTVELAKSVIELLFDMLLVSWYSREVYNTKCTLDYTVSCIPYLLDLCSRGTIIFVG